MAARLANMLLSVLLFAFAALLTPGLALPLASASGHGGSAAEVTQRVTGVAGGGDAAAARRLQLAEQGGFAGFLINNLPGIIFGVVFNLTFALVYKLKVVNKIPKLQQMPPSTEADFKPGLNDCLRDRHLCLHVCIFGPCRVAHTWHVAGLLSYWPAIFLQACCGLCVGAHFRAKLKHKMGIQTTARAECKTVLNSQCCAIGQEAMAVDSELGVKTHCCCQLEQLEPQQVTMAPAPTILAAQSPDPGDKATVVKAGSS